MTSKRAYRISLRTAKSLFFVCALLCGFQAASSELHYKVQMRWDPQTNSISISENAIGLPPSCEECVSPIEWMQCGNNLTPVQINGEPGCETIIDTQGFSIDIKFNNATQCTASSTPYKPEWAIFVSNLPNGVTGIRTANLTAISEQTTYEITCSIGTPDLKLHAVNSLKLNEMLEESLMGALYTKTASRYNIIDAQKQVFGLKTKMDVMKSKRVEYRLRQHGDSIVIAASTSRADITLPIPNKVIAPNYDVWVVVTDNPVDIEREPFQIESIGSACQSLASNTKNKQAAINFSSAGDPGLCALTSGQEYWLTWYLFERLEQ